MIFNLFKQKQGQNPLLDSELHNEITFYTRFIKDLERAEKEVIIESPFISSARMQHLYPIFAKLIKRNIKVYVITRDPKDQSDILEQQSESEIQRFERLGVQVLLCVGNHHRKLAVIDRSVLWEGSLNILSQAFSREIMRRIDSKELSLQMFKFLKFEKIF